MVSFHHDLYTQNFIVVMLSRFQIHIFSYFIFQQEDYMKHCHSIKRFVFLLVLTILLNTLPADSRSLDLNIQGSGSVVIEYNDQNHRCTNPSCILDIADGSRVVITASPSPGFGFSRWSGSIAPG
jgi:hypothetical protein